jgi:hypothetical protein
MRQAELNRFLNHIKREENSLLEKNQSQKNLISNLQSENQALNSKLYDTINELDIAKQTISKKINEEDVFLLNVKKLLGKLRINIYTNTNKCTPCFFKTGKFWSRETGGFTTEEIENLTREELIEAFNFYCSTNPDKTSSDILYLTELPFLVDNN